MSMYTHATTRARILHGQDTFRSYTQMHADDLGEVILRLDGNPGTRVTGHPSPVVLVTGHFFYFFIFFLAKR